MCVVMFETGTVFGVSLVFPVDIFGLVNYLLLIVS